MSLLAEFQDMLNEEEHADPNDVKAYIPDAVIVSDKFVDSGRWTEYWTAVFKCDDEYVALDYEVPATEYQEGSEGESEVYAVRPVEVTVTKYVRLKDRP